MGAKIWEQRGSLPPGAPLTETIDHAGYFIQMALASLPKRMEGVIDQKYPKWRESRTQ